MTDFKNEGFAYVDDSLTILNWSLVKNPMNPDARLRKVTTMTREELLTETELKELRAHAQEANPSVWIPRLIDHIEYLKKRCERAEKNEAIGSGF